MYHFFIKPEQAAAHEVAIIGSDVNHIKNVLRMKVGEQICVNDGSHEYLCSIARLDAEEVTAKIEQVSETTSELPSRIVLFQGLPKADKMETIIQKCVELGVHEIVPRPACFAALSEIACQRFLFASSFLQSSLTTQRFICTGTISCTPSSTHLEEEF